jgi:hypothetical protein
MSHKEHFAEASKIYGTVNVDRDQLNIFEQKIFTIKRQLTAIPENSSKYGEAQVMLKAITPLDEELKSRQAAKAPSPMVTS